MRTPISVNLMPSHIVGAIMFLALMPDWLKAIAWREQPLQPWRRCGNHAITFVLVLIATGSYPRTVT